MLTKALVKDWQNLDWVGVGPEASIGKVIPGKAKANLRKVNTIGFFEIRKLPVDVTIVNIYAFLKSKIIVMQYIYGFNKIHSKVWFFFLF